MRTTIGLLCSAMLVSGCGGDGLGNSPYPAAIATVTLTSSSAGDMASLGETRTVTAVVKDANQTVVTSPRLAWSSSAPAVATVTGTGTGMKVTAIGDGTATITASTGSAQGTLTVTVRQKVASIVLTATTTQLTPGSTTQLTATGRDALLNPIGGLTGFTYASNNASKIVVSPTGLVTAIIVNSSATLTASLSRDSATISGTVNVRVSAPPTFDFASHLLGENERPTPVTTNGDGLAYFLIDGDRSRYTISWVSLSGPATNAHIHGPGTTAQAGGVLVDFAPANQTTNYGVLTGSFTAADIRPQGGAKAISLDSLIVLMVNRNAYINVHTATNTGGEIRGQIVGPFR